MARCPAMKLQTCGCWLDSGRTPRLGSLQSSGRERLRFLPSLLFSGNPACCLTYVLRMQHSASRTSRLPPPPPTRAELDIFTMECSGRADEVTRSKLHAHRSERDGA